MVKELIHDTIFLGQKSQTANADDIKIANDLLDTLKYYQDECVGMAANMIGVKKRIIAFNDRGKFTVMFNPEIIQKLDEYETEESCLSLLGGPRKIKRYKKIKVKYQNSKFRFKVRTFHDRTAQIIQHEIDHCNGILI